MMLFGVCTAHAMNLYSFVDERGVIHLTSHPNDPRYRRLVLNDRLPIQSQSYHRMISPPPKKRAFISKPDLDRNRGVDTLLNREKFVGIIQDVSERTGIHSALLRAVIHAESSFNPDATSSKGAVGLMQLMPGTARMYGVDNLRDPATNVDVGARHLSVLLKRFNNNLSLSLAAYNAGAQAVINYGRVIPPFPETRRYVTKVLRYYREYRLVM